MELQYDFGSTLQNYSVLEPLFLVHFSFAKSGYQTIMSPFDTGNSPYALS